MANYIVGGSIMPYIEVTKICLKNKELNTQVVEAKYVEKEGIKYFVDGKYVILDYSKKELEIANWLVNTFGGKIYLLPRINYPKKIKTADYLWNNEFWDLKEIVGNSKQVLYHSIFRNMSQSKNFIFDISFCKISLKEIKKQIADIFRRINDLNIIILKKKDLFFIYKRT